VVVRCLLWQLHRIIKDAGDTLLDECPGRRHHLFKSIAAVSADELEPQVICPVRSQLRKMRVDLPADEAKIRSSLRERSEKRDARALLACDVRSAAALTAQQPSAFQIAHRAGNGRARCRKSFGQLRFCRQTIARLKPSRRNLPKEGVEN